MKKNYVRGLVSLSADPVTVGHVDLIERALRLCEEVVVYVSYNDAKAGRYTFSLGQRMRFVERAVAYLGTSVRVIGGDALLMDVFLKEGCDVLFRGIRNAEDERYEDAQIANHALVYPPIKDKVVYLRARPEFAQVSSSLVKSFVSRSIDVSRFVSAEVKAELEARIVERYLVGVTGELASGKSTLTQAMVQVCGEWGTPALHVDVDALSREALFEDSRGGDLLRSALARMLGDDALFVGDREVVLARFRTAFFREGLSEDVCVQVHTLIKPHVERLYRERVGKFRGVVFYEWAQLAEMRMFGFVNNVAVVVESPDRAELAEQRGVPKAQYEYVSSLQWSADKKAEALEACIAHEGGYCVRAKNLLANDLIALARSVVDELSLHGYIPSVKREGGGWHDHGVV